MLKKITFATIIIIIVFLSVILLSDYYKYYLKKISFYILKNELKEEDFNFNIVANDFKNFILNTKLKYINSNLYLKTSEEDLINKKYKFKIKKFSYPEYSYYDLEMKPVGYLESYDDKVLIVSGMGEITYFNTDELNTNEINVKKINSNLEKIILDPFFYIPSRSSIKDIYILEDHIYLSYTKLNMNKCYNLEVLRAKVNFAKLNFKKYFSFDQCIYNNTYLNNHSSGGRITNFNGDLILSIGEFQHRNLAQNLNNNFGKIILLSKNSKESKILSYGHRNVQGLKHLSDKNIIISTEHGPMGGDEININKLQDVKIKNFGWPISSYGEHYAEFITCESKGFKEKKFTMFKIISFANYDECEVSKLKKSHKKNGFVEPIKYYVPSIGISEIIELFVSGKKIENSFILTSLRAASIYFIEFNDDFSKIYYEETFEINERIRDIIYLKNKNSYLMLLEDSPSIATLKLIN